MKDKAYIQVGLRPLPFGAEEFTFEWVGPERAPVIVDRRTIARLTGDGGPLKESFPAKLDLRGIPLRLIPGSENDHDAYFRDGALYARADGANALRWAYHSAQARIRRPLRWAGVRLILTLYVWGLADWRKGETMSWRCVRRPRRRGLTTLGTRLNLRFAASTAPTFTLTFPPVVPNYSQVAPRPDTPSPK